MLEKFREYLSRLGKSKNTIATYLQHVGLYFRWCEDSFGSVPAQFYRPNVLDYQTWSTLANIMWSGV